MQFPEVLKARVSTRAFRPDPVPEACVQSILDAALYAPVGMHRFETLHLTVVTDRTVLEGIRQCVVRETGDAAADPLHGAPLLIVVSSSEERELGALNVSCLVENMLLAATDLGLGNLYVRGAIALAAKDEECVKMLRVPQGYTPVASVAIGYAAVPSAPRETPKNDVTAIDYLN